MSTEKYSVYSLGYVLNGFDRNSVLSSLQEKFKISANAADNLLSNRVVKLKASLSLPEAVRYCEALAQMGVAVKNEIDLIIEESGFIFDSDVKNDNDVKKAHEDPWQKDDTSVDNEPKLNEFSSIFDIIQRGSVKTFVSVVQENPVLVHTKDDSGRSLLLFAAMCDKPEMVDFLLQNGANINDKDSSGAGLEVYAGASIRKVLAKYGASSAGNFCNTNGQMGGLEDSSSTTDQDFNGQAPEQDEIIDDSKTTGSSQSQIFRLIEQGLLNEVVEHVSKSPQSVFLRDSANRTPLLFALIHDNVEIVDFLMRSKSDVNAVDFKGRGFAELARGEKIKSMLEKHRAQRRASGCGELFAWLAIPTLVLIVAAAIFSSTESHNAEAFIKKRLKSPDSFKSVSSETVWEGKNEKGNKAAIVRVVFDANNSFGAALRGCYFVAIYKENGDWWSSNTNGLSECDWRIATSKEDIEIIRKLNFE
ncbi:ankyrin repeat domain-containing protein [Chitinilyticum piscinae]|uniref:Ankyrin repeat domain-containing protein n=1 Tax=Chitinilyticum piscinae TaxID=2866724 RepID=A0A8J7K2V3_9NEIS|nr:ankyrin repeat domain-containing protein [Chitinilyticum piscinae]MBE9611036.1 ankyrin repeat domain-containing protein [Chitinilyticum piscinae]